MGRGRSRGASLNLPNCGRVEKTERRSKTHVGDSESPLFIHQRAALFLELKRAGALTPEARGEKSKHTDLDMVYLESDTKNQENMLSSFLKKRGPSHFGLSFLLYLR